MSYVPTEWKTGDIVTAEKLNKMENALADDGGSNLVITATYDESLDSYVIEKSFNDLLELYKDKTIVTVLLETNENEARIYEVYHLNCLTDVSEVAEPPAMPYLALFATPGEGGATFQFSASTADENMKT